ncbi:MAG: DUF6531 domain-containing protein, partial [Planctomycetota bacterium]
MRSLRVMFGIAFVGLIQPFLIVDPNRVMAWDYFEPPTQSAPVAAVEVDVMETTQRRIEAENSYSAHLFSGEVFFEQEDLRIPGRGFDFVWKRKYRSREGIATAMGINWDHLYNIYVDASGPNLILHDGNSRRDTFTPDAGGTTWSAPGFFQQIIQNPDGTFTVLFAHRSYWVLAALNDPVKPGRILSITDRNGNTMSFTYSGAGRLVTVTDTLNRAITISYNLQGYISVVTDFATALGIGGQGRKVQYSYYQNGDSGGGAGDLKSVTYPAVVNTPTGNDFPNGKSWTYTYTKGFANNALNHNLITITDAKSQSYLVNSYATTQTPTDLDFDRVIAQMTSNLGGRSFNFFYVVQTPSAGNEFAVIKTIVNDRAGNVEELFFDAGNHLVIRREYTGRAPNPSAQTTETINRPVLPLRPGVDPTYFETKFTYNSDSLLTEVVYPNGNSVQYAFDESNLSPLARGNLLSRLSLPGAIPSDQFEICELWAYDSIFQFPTQHQDGRGFITEWFYDSTGDRGAFPVDCNSSLRSGAPSSGLEHTFDTVFMFGPGNGTGNQESTKCPSNDYGHLAIPPPFPAGGGCVGECFSYEYNSFGQVTARINRNDRRDEMTYYTSGPMTGYLQSYTVDAPNLALTTTYEYDAVGNIARVIDPQGKDTILIVNALNQVVRRQSRQIEVSPGQFVRYERDIRYDANDNVVSIDEQNIDENGVLSSNPYFTQTDRFYATRSFSRRRRT